MQKDQNYHAQAVQGMAGAHDIRRINHVKIKVAMTAEDMIKYRVTR